MVKKKKRASLNETDSTAYLLPLIIAVAIVPLIVFMKVEVLQGLKLDYWKGGDKNLDFFSYYKMIWVCICAISIIFFTLIKILMGKANIYISKVYVLMAIYAVLIVFSSFTSPYRDIAFNGFVERYEGMYILLSYLLLMFGAISFCQSERDIRIVIISLILSSSIIGLIGIGQFLGYDFFRSGYGKLLILPKKYENIAESLQFAFGKNTIYATLYNPNYVGSYAAMLFPLCVGLFIGLKSIGSKISIAVVSILMFIVLLGSQSRAGLLGFFAAFIVMVVMMRKYIIQHIKSISIIFVCFLAAFFIMNFVSGGIIIYRIKALVPQNEYKLSSVSIKSNYIKNIKVDGKKFFIATNTESLTLLLDGQNISFLGNGNKVLAVKNTNNVITFDDLEYSAYQFLVTDKGYITAKITNKEFNIYFSETGFRIAGLKNVPDDIVYPDSIGFKENETFGSSRGYIWSRTIPLLKKSIIFGYGPDTFTVVFPQKDYLGKLNAFGITNQIVDKPHNLYLQISISTGVLSLFVFMAIVTLYVVNSVRLYINISITDFVDIMGVSVLAAIVGYCVAGVFNDSVVSVAPIFWVLFGLGFAANNLRVIRNQK